MTMYQWSYPDGSGQEVVVYITDYEIILERWVWWSQLVFKVRPDNTFLITPENCIDEYVITHWATEVKNGSLEINI